MDIIGGDCVFAFWLGILIYCVCASVPTLVDFAREEFLEIAEKKEGV
jgi:hypothetical protein